MRLGLDAGQLAYMAPRRIVPVRNGFLRILATVREEQVSRSRVARSLKLGLKNFDEFTRQQHTPRVALLRPPPGNVYVALVEPDPVKLDLRGFAGTAAGSPHKFKPRVQARIRSTR